MNEHDTEIYWLPLETDPGYAGYEFPLITFGLGDWHDNADSVPMPELPGTPSLDPEIVGLVLALNNAGIETFQSCQDIAGVDSPDSELPEDVPRFGCVVVRYDTYPALARLIFPHGGQRDGWLCSVHSESPHSLFVSVLFPWRDLDEFMQAIPDEASAQPGNGAAENDEPQP